MTDDSIQDAIDSILPTLPDPIRNLFAEKKLEPVVLDIKDKYNLHVDDSAVVERELILLLLGVESPEEVAAALGEDLPVSNATVADIMNDFNEQVFIPLQQQMRGDASAQVGPTTAAVSVPQPVAAPIPVPPAPRSVVPTPASFVPPRSASTPAATSSAPLPPKMVLPQQAPGGALGASDYRKIVPLPANLPGQVAPSINIGLPPLQKPVAPPAPKPAPRPYTVDPYREQPDEQ